MSFPNKHNNACVGHLKASITEMKCMAFKETTNEISSVW